MNFVYRLNNNHCLNRCSAIKRTVYCHPSSFHRQILCHSTEKFGLSKNYFYTNRTDRTVSRHGLSSSRIGPFCFASTKPSDVDNTSFISHMEEKTQNLLNDENCDQNQSIRGKKELIVKYITEWSQIWSRRASKDEKELSAFSSDKETRKSQREIQLYKDDVILGAHMSDALLHLLLDIKETELNELFPQKPKKKQELSDSLERICNNVITGWARSMDPQNALKAETILKRMEFLYDYYSLVEIRPSICTYTSVMDAWSKSQDPLAGKYAEDILIRMKETNIFAHEGSEKDALVMATNTVINAYSQKGNLEAAERLLGDMEKPDVYSYTTVIQAYNTSASPKNKSAKNAEKHLQTMYQLYKSTRNDKIRPNSITFHTGKRNHSEKKKNFIVNDF